MSNTMQWLTNLKELKAEKQMSTKQIAELSNLPEKTVARILSGHTASPYLDTLDRIAAALGVTLNAIIADTTAVVADTTLPVLQEKLDIAKAENDELAAAFKVLQAENNILQKQVDAQAEKIELLQMQLRHKEELLAVHNYYITKQSQQGG